MKSPPAILHVITAIDRGGAENHLFDLVKHQCASGMRVTVAYLRGHGYWAEPMRALGAAVHDLCLRFYGDLRPLRKLRALLAANHFNLVHSHLPPAELYARLALANLGETTLPFLISKHNDCPFHRLPGERWLGRWVARRASRVIAISNAVHRYMTGPALGLPVDQVRTILYGIDAAPFVQVAPETVAALRREWGATDDTVLIGFAGRFVEQKDIPTLIRGFALFLEAAPCDARLVLMGAGPLAGELRGCAAAAGVGDRVVFPGFREDVPAAMNAFDIFAITSLHEGFGLVLVEAMAAAKPVVATRAGAMPEIVVHGKTGFLADDATSVAQAFARLADPELRQRLGAAGRARVEREFAVDRMCAETDAEYRRALSSETSAPSPATLVTV